MNNTLNISRKKSLMLVCLLCIIITSISLLLVGCKGTTVSLKYLNGQVALVAKGKNELKTKDGASSYKSVLDDITINFEVYNITPQNNNLLVINDFEVPLNNVKTTRNSFTQNQLKILGANVIDGELKLTFKAGLDTYGNLDMFSIRNVFIEVGSQEIWSVSYPKSDYFNEQLNMGRNDLNTKLRYNYQPERVFEFTIDDKELNAQAVLLDNPKKEIDFTFKGKERVLQNLSFIDVSLNIAHKAQITQSFKLQVEADGDEVNIQTFMDGMMVTNDLSFSKNAWASGEHTLKVMAINKYGFILEKNLEFTLGDMSSSTSTLNYKMFDPGLADSLEDKITALGKEVSGNNYTSGFSDVVQLNYEITPNEDKTFLWTGFAPQNRTVFMQIYNATSKKYETVSTIISDGSEQSLGYELNDNANYLSNGKIYLRVGNMNLSTQKNVTAQIFHLSDIQYMSQRSAINIGSSTSNEYRKGLNALADFLIEQDAATTYSAITGDIVQSLSNVVLEWEAAMGEFFDPLLASPARFGVSSGNHDVGGISENSPLGSSALDDELYDNYFSENLGEAVFKDRGYYGGSYLDNRSHYDLVTLGGHDFLFLYLGWGSSIPGISVSAQDIAYGKTVLEQYPDRSVVIATHNYMSATNARNATGEYVFSQLVKKYSNVKMVISGHINSTSKLVDYIDDDGDGITDRQVLQLLTNFQEEESLYGATFIRLIGLDFTNSQLVLDLYSPYIKASDILVTNRPDQIKENTRFTYSFDLNNLGYGMRSGLLK